MGCISQGRGRGWHGKWNNRQCTWSMSRAKVSPKGITIVAVIYCLLVVLLLSYTWTGRLRTWSAELLNAISNGWFSSSRQAIYSMGISFECLNWSSSYDRFWRSIDREEVCLIGHKKQKMTTTFKMMMMMMIALNRSKFHWQGKKINM